MITPFEEIKDSRFQLNESEEIIQPVSINKAVTRAEAFRLRGEATAIAEKPRRSTRISNHNTNLTTQIENTVKEKQNTPLTVVEALTGPDKLLWKPSIEAEVKVYTSLDCLKPIPSLPPGKKSMKLKVVFKIKRDQLNQVKYKTRIALKGYSQQAGIDNDLTYAPTLSNNSFFMIIEYAVIHD